MKWSTAANAILQPSNEGHLRDLDEPAHWKFARPIVWSVATVAFVAGWACSYPVGGRVVSEDADLTRLMHMMAVLKLGMAAGTLWLIDWRLRSPTPNRFTVGYAAAAALIAAGPPLIWDPPSVLAGAFVFHAGLGLLLLVGLRDRAPIGDRLARIARERAAARTIR